jgi:hypothetical protein
MSSVIHSNFFASKGNIKTSHLRRQEKEKGKGNRKTTAFYGTKIIENIVAK